MKTFPLTFSAILLSFFMQNLFAGVNHCTVSATDINFGECSSERDKAIRINGRISIKCDSKITTTLLVGISPENNQRKLEYEGHKAGYNLYKDASLTRVWGDSEKTKKAVLVKEGFASVRIYGVVYPGKHAYPGIYSQILKVTIEN